MGIPVIQRWQNDHWIFDRWPTNEEIKEEKILCVCELNSNINLNDNVLEHTRFNANVLLDYNLYNIDKANELDDKMKHAIWLTVKPSPLKGTFTKIDDIRFPIITDSQVYIHNENDHVHKYLVTQLEIESSATQGNKGTDHTWVGSDYDGGYCPRRCRCPCCGRSY
jgi:hypothetical protein